MPIRIWGFWTRATYRRPSAALPLLLALGVSGCGVGGWASAEGAGGDAARLRFGVLPNITHAPALVGVERGLFAAALGEGVDLHVSYFNAGGEAVEALFSGAVDLAYLGPNPAINAHAQSAGTAVRVVAGSTSGGAFLVVRDGIREPADLAGATLASPALGSTQDVALRAWLGGQGHETDVTGGGDVSVRPLPNPDILQAFQLGELDGAWVPEPWATRLVQEGGGRVLVDEADLWPEGRFVTTHLLVRTELLERSPDLVRRFLDGHLAAIDAVNDDPAAARATVLDAIERISGTRLPEAVVAAAWRNLEFTWDPVATTLARAAADARDAGLLDPVELDGIHDLTILNVLLRERGEQEVHGL